MTKIPWRGKERKSGHAIFTATKLGGCISVDQLISTHAGLFGQNQEYHYATVFVDHYSRLQYVHLMSSLNSEETIATKRAFERFAAKHGVQIKHYHCDNGQFADNAFVAACQESCQKLTFCGVNAHFQNGIAERAICDLTENAWKQLLHAMQCWPQAVSVALWPNALKMPHCSTTQCQLARMGHHASSSSVLSKWVFLSSMHTPLVAPCLHSKRNWLLDPQSQDGAQEHALG